MSRGIVDILGFTAGTLTALAFLPQVLKTWRRRSATDLSVLMLSAQASGVALWIVYGVAVGARPVIFSNSVTLALTLLLLFFKKKYSTG